MPAINPSFHTTRWTCVLRARQETEDGRRALADLCEAYYAPVQAFLRCELRDVDAAAEMSQAFFTRVLEGGAFQGADHARGRFRAYVLGAVKHFLANQREAAKRHKRGAGQALLPLDDEAAKAAQGPAHATPDAIFDRQWAVTILARALETVRSECLQEGRQLFFEAAKPLLTGDSTHGDQAAQAAACGMNAPAFRTAVHRLKKRLRQCVQMEVASTLEHPAQVEEEMRTLFWALSQ